MKRMAAVVGCVALIGLMAWAVVNPGEAAAVAAGGSVDGAAWMEYVCGGGNHQAGDSPSGSADCKHGQKCDKCEQCEKCKDGAKCEGCQNCKDCKDCKEFKDADGDGKCDSCGQCDKHASGKGSCHKSSPCPHHKSPHDGCKHSR